MGFGLQWIVDKITFPSPPSSYSLTSHPELFFVKGPRARPSYPGVPCMLYAVPQGAPVLVVHAHSNGCDIGDMRQTLQNISESLRVHVMSFEFPGYGLHVGSANMRSIDEAAMAVADFLIHELRINISQVVWYGRSIGSGPALRMVHRISKELQQQPGGVVLQCGYANFPEVAGHLFGRVAKKLVSPLWPNEAMLKELHCPVLLIHGRNDTMIPIEQSQKLWNAVKAKEQSHFHACDCGHNDFNFRRCTLRPIYDFLLGVISAPTFPATNFNIEISPSNHTFVHHIGPLRSKIPVYSFRRPELEEWLRKFMRQGGSEAGDEAAGAAAMTVLDGSPVSAAAARPTGAGSVLFRSGQRVSVHSLRAEEGGTASNGKEGHLLSFEQQDSHWRLRLDSGEILLLRPENLLPGGVAEGAPAAAEGAGKGAPAAAEDAGKPAPAGAEADEKPLWQPADEKGSLKAKGRELQKQEAATDDLARRTLGHLQTSMAVVAGPISQPPSTISTPKRRKSRKGKASGNEEPPIPDFSVLAPIGDVAQALIEPEGIVRTCAIRVAAFLDRVQGQLNRVEGLEAKPLEEVVDLVEAEFWASDPLLCLWEEVSLPHGDRVRIRLGPFSVDSTGERTVDHGLGAGSASAPAGWLRIPIWLFCPSPAHFRCLAEWSLLHSERLERNLPAASQAVGASACCCVPSGRLTSRRRQKSRGGGRFGDGAAHPTRGVLSTSLAAHFAHWVEKNDDIKTIFTRFAALYASPDGALGRSIAASSAVTNGPPLAPKDLPSDLPPRSGSSSSGEEEVREVHPGDEEDLSSPRGRGAACNLLASAAHCRAGGAGKEGDELLAPARRLFPLSPTHFSASSRAMLREGISAIGSNLAELHGRTWGPGACREGNVCDFQQASELVASLGGEGAHTESDRHADWRAAGLLLHYERLMCGAASSGAAAAPGPGEEAWGDPLRPDARKTGLALNKAVKAFAQAEHRERRDCQQYGPRQMPRGAQPPNEFDGSGPDPPPPPPAAAAAPATSGAGAVPSAEARRRGPAG